MVHLCVFVCFPSPDVLSEVEAMKSAGFTPVIGEYLEIMHAYAMQGECVTYTIPIVHTLVHSCLYLLLFPIYCI